MASNTSKQPKPHYKQAVKEQRKKEITSLLAIMGPMDAATITQTVADLSGITICRYLDELLKSGHIRLLQARSKPKNMCAYELLIEYGAKTDMVSCAISHPLHQLMHSFARKAELQTPHKFRTATPSALSCLALKEGL